MTTITREQQKQILIDTANHVINRDNTSPYSENLRELARIALASLTDDTNSHPASGPLSDYRLHRIREILGKAAAQSDGGNLGYAMSDAVKAIDELLEVRKAEPVAWTDEEELRDVCRVGFGEMFSVEPISPNADMCRVIPLYTAPPAPVVDADDNFYSWFGREWEQYYQPNNYSLSAKKHLGAIAESAWFACRAAMLNGGKS